MEQYNTFTLRLTDYIIQNHPDRIMEKDFITQRGEAAKQTFAECARMGCAMKNVSSSPTAYSIGVFISHR